MFGCGCPATGARQGFDFPVRAMGRTALGDRYDRLPYNGSAGKSTPKTRDEADSDYAPM